MESRARLIVSAGWLVTTAIAATVATAALHVLGAGILGPATQTIDENEVRRQLGADRPAPGTQNTGPSGARDQSSADASAPAISPNPSASPPTGAAAGAALPAGKPASSPTRSSAVLATPGGTIVAQCSGDQVSLVSWSPAQGYRTDEVSSGPASATSVTFKSDGDRIVVTVTCQNGTPVDVVQMDSKGGGGGHREPGGG